MVHVKRFFELNSTRGSIGSAELINFKRACTPTEWDAYVAQAEAVVGGLKK